MVVTGTGVPGDTTVVGAPVGNRYAFQPCYVPPKDRLQFKTIKIEVENASGINVGMLVIGDGVPDGTTVEQNDVTNNSDGFGYKGSQLILFLLPM